MPKFLMVARRRIARRRTTGLLAPALACALTASALTGCGIVEEAKDHGDPTAVATFTVLADLAQRIGGDEIEVESLIPAGAEIHGYEPTPGDMMRVAKADLILENGMGLEAWIDQLLGSTDAEHITLSDGVEPMPIEAGEYEGAENPHAWMSPDAAATYVDNIVDAFSELDPAHARTFERRAAAYKKELAAIGDELLTALDHLPESQRALVSCEGAFSYLARDAGLTEQYLWPVNSDAQATPQQVSETVDFVRDNDVRAVFCETTVSSSTMEQVAGEADSSYGGPLFVDSLSEEGGEVPDYLSLLRYDVDLITRGLTGKAS